MAKQHNTSKAAGKTRTLCATLVICALLCTAATVLAGCSSIKIDATTKGKNTLLGNRNEMKSPLNVPEDCEIYLIDTEYVNGVGFAVAEAPKSQLNDRQAQEMREIFQRADSVWQWPVPDGMDILYGDFEEDIYVFVYHDDKGVEWHINYMQKLYTNYGCIDFGPGLESTRVLDTGDMQRVEKILQEVREQTTDIPNPPTTPEEDALNGEWSEVSLPLNLQEDSPIWLIDKAYVSEYGFATGQEPRTQLDETQAQKMREIFQHTDIVHIYREPAGRTVEYSAFVGQDIYVFVYLNNQGDEWHINYMQAENVGSLQVEPGFVHYRTLLEEDTQCIESIIAEISSTP